MTQNIDSPQIVWSPGLSQRTNSPVSKLVKEWQLISSRHNEVDVVNSWKLPGGKVANLDQVLVRAGFNTARDDSQGDSYLWLLVKRASDEELAARIVLQRILPPLVAIARRRGQIIDGGIDAAIAEVLPTAWTVIRQYPWHRRPNKVASNLVLDSEYFAFVQANRAKRIKVFAVEPNLLGELVAEPEANEFAPEVSLENLISLAISQGIEPRHIEVLRAVASGQTAATIAKHYGIAERTARAWRAVAISELRARTRCAV
ncbi:MAG: hypothetical protein CK542_02575 [Acidimicrobium sp.]|nr:MAG: hypothetical protein CK542_02575 [Acidimicrobium sp.]